MIKWDIKLTPEVSRLLSKLHPENKKLIKNALKEIINSPYSGAALQGELSGFRSFKPKRYRIIYKISEENRRIEIYHIGHRRDVYEQFRDLLNKFKG